MPRFFARGENYLDGFASILVRSAILQLPGFIMRAGSLFIVLMLCSIGVSQPLAADDVRDAYRTQWGDRERKARSAEDRHGLAEELIGAAERESDPAMAVYLCDRAYAAASRDRVNFAVAARALDRMKRIDPDSLTDALEKLAYLYQQAYRQAPQQVLFGLGHADVLEQLAEQRVEAVSYELDQGRLDPRAASDQVGKAVADLAVADRGLRGVVPKINKYVELAQTQAPDRLDEFRALADRAARIHERVRSRQAELRAERTVWIKLAGLMARFERSPGAPLARSIALVLTADLDRPDAIPANVTEAMDEADRQMILASFRSPRQLEPKDLFALGDWFERHATEVASDAGQIIAMSRATYYFDHADRKGEERASGRLADSQQKLTALAGEDLASKAIAALDARLTYVAPPQTQAAPAPIDEPTVTTTDVEPYDPQITTTDTVPVDPAGDNDPVTPVTATTTTSAEPADTVGGRPMVECAECGRRFFPGWGVTDVTKCPRCAEGRENIFDFGDD
jgi:hypothetical protein